MGIAINIANFDESKVNWQRLPDLDHLWLSILDVDDTAKVVDVLFKFAANEKIVLHRHVSAFHTFFVQGEHRIYEPSGDLKEVRPVGTPTRQDSLMKSLTQKVVETQMW